MSFEALTPKRTWTGETAPVRAGLVMMRGAQQASLWIVLSARVLAALAPGKTPPARLGADIGTGCDEGLVRLRLPREGETGFAVTKLPAGTSVRIALGHIPSLPNERRATAAAGHAFRDGALVVTLPPSIARAPSFGGPSIAQAPVGTQREAAPASRPPDAKPAPAPATAPATAAAAKAAPKAGVGAAAAIEPAPARISVVPKRLTIDDALFAQLSVKAGIAFGCSRIEALAPTADEHWDAFNAIAQWMAKAGYADIVIRKKLKIASQDVLVEVLATPMPRAAFERFAAMVGEAMKLAGSAA